MTGTNGIGYGGVPQSTWSFGYDTAERHTSDTGVLGKVIDGLDANGNRTSLTYPNGTVIRTGYDTLNHPTVTVGFGATASTNIMADFFDPFDRLFSRDLGANLWYTNFEYDLGGVNNLLPGGRDWT